MGANTKESIDRDIAYHQGQIASDRAKIANTKDQTYKRNLRVSIADHQKRIAELRAKRKSCKN